jgi:UDP-N-acetylmuramate dehydrogenase
MIDRAAREHLEHVLGDGLRFGVPMARLTSLRIGGPADAVAAPASRPELAALLRVCAAHRLPHHVVGGGFNLLALDGPLPGVVVQLGRFRRLEERPGGALRAEAGVSHSQVARFCTEKGLSGLEFGAGIPGTVGGWLAMNAGVPGREMRDVVIELEVMSPTGSTLRHLPRERIHFVYRGLRGLAPGSVLVSALLRVSPTRPERVRADIERLLARRSDTQPLNVPSCGSVFKNPPGDYAGRLIEAAGLKGFRIGGAEISPVHANFIANTGNACAADVLALIEIARATVHERTGLHLETEVHFLGGIS